MTLTYVTKEDWQKFSADAHLSVFKEKYDPNQERIDFALLCADPHGTLVLYCTFTELDAETVYMNFGGSFPPYRGSAKAYEAYCEFVSWLSKKYKHLYFHVENINFSMLKFAIKVEAKIIGVSHGKTGKILIEHHLELNCV